MRVDSSLAGALVLTLAVCGCAGTPPAQRAADAATKAVYDDDLNAIQSSFDPALRARVTLASAAALSQKLRALGTYRGLSATGAESAIGRYDFTATFGSAPLAVHVRLDGDGRIAAYRIDVPQNVSVRN